MPITINDRLLLSQTDKSQADADACYLLKHNFITEPPTPITKLIYYAIPNVKIRHGLLPRGLGGYSIFGSDECEVVINNFYPDPSQRFASGHELGHLLRCESGPRDEKTLTEPVMKWKERLADYYAACLLMPEVMIRKYWRYYPSHETMASVFKVSKQSMIIRLKWLHILSYNEAEQLLAPYTHFSPMF